MTNLENDQRCPTCENPASDPKESRVGLNEYKTCEDQFHEPSVATWSQCPRCDNGIYNGKECAICWGTARVTESLLARESAIRDQDLVSVTLAAWDSLTGEVVRLRKLRSLLYAAIVELQYVQDAEDHSLCASSKGKEIIERSMELLGVSHLSEETLFHEE